MFGDANSELRVEALPPNPSSADAGMTFVTAWYWVLETQDSHEKYYGYAREFKEGVLVAPSDATYCNSTAVVSITLTLSNAPIAIVLPTVALVMLSLFVP